MKASGGYQPGMRICVDFGTALSKATMLIGYADDGSPDIAPLPIGAACGADHPLLTPSAMFVDSDHILFGPAAITRARDTVKASRNPILSFKLILSAADIAASLNYKLNPSLDPTGTLTYRDALTLYIAYIDQLIRKAVAAEPTLPPGALAAPRRITSPLWRIGDGAIEAINTLFSQAMAVSENLGAQLLTGPSLQTARAALARAAECGRSPLFEGLVLEAHAAAAAYASFVRAPARFVLVVDMGAGTTDIAGFEMDADGNGPRAFDIEGTQRCSTLAGDELDYILIDRFAQSRGKMKPDAASDLWRGLRLSTADLKRELFERGRASFKDEKRKYAVSRDKLLSDASFRAYCKALSNALAESIAPTAAKARARGANSITILLAGGGANLPFLADLVKLAGAKHARGLKLVVEPFGAKWSLPHQHHPFAGALPQLAIAMGGAVAPVLESANMAEAAA
ncbi:MAG TPA: Hsp70 family protein [Vitreimonas sp.]|nr:Hsp70 family protein [Vitreimonas sp.]